MTYADAMNRMSGVLVAPDALLFLKFQINPITLTFSKAATWHERTIPGWDRSQHWWVSGGEKSVSFDLAFHDTKATHSGGINLHSPVSPAGLRGTIAILEAMVYPQRSYDALASISGVRDIPRVILNLVEDQSYFRPPPELFFVYGFRIWKGHINPPLDITENKHDKLLNPQDFSVRIKFVVHEEGTWQKIETGTRTALSFLASGTGAIQSAGTIIGGIL